MLSLAIGLLAAVVTVPAGDGASIQKAIDEVSAQGGGRVVVPAGEYRSPSLRLKSNVELHLAKGALLRGGTRSEDYFDFPTDVCAVRPEKSGRVFIYAWDAENIAITGEGIIDGRAKEFFSRTESEWNFTWPKPEAPRPRMVQFVRCRNIRLEGVTFEDSPGWTMLIRLCENLTVDNVFVNADHRVINSDGIDLDGCRHVKIRNSRINTGDDCIIVRAMREAGSDERIVCEDIEVTDCHLDSACQAFRMGCPSDDTIRNVRIRNIRASGYNGINFDYPVGYLRPTDEGYMDISDIRVENFSGNFINCAVRMNVGPGVKLRRVADVTLRGFKVRSIHPLQFLGNADSPLVNVTLEDFTADVAGAKPYEARATEPLKLVNCTFNGEKVPDATVVTPRGAREPLVRPKRQTSWETVKQGNRD